MTAKNHEVSFEITPEITEKLQTIVKQSELNITIHDDGTFSGPVGDYFQFIALMPGVTPEGEDFIGFLAQRAAREYYEAELRRIVAEKASK
ncbi:hypothetical protein H5T51_08670 [Candidatus Bathyarchaeota archaeon]|nr:hypothetical protein [Candidatus Bathyarchaeota archaeon]